MSKPAFEPGVTGNFVRAQGAAFLAHILRRLADELVRGAGEWYPEVGVTAPPRTTSTLLALEECGPLGVTQIAALLRQSHPLVIGWCRQLAMLGFVTTQPDCNDARRTIVALTKEGLAEVLRLRRALKVMEKASEALMEEGGLQLFDALWRMDGALQTRRLADRLRSEANSIS